MPTPSSRAVAIIALALTASSYTLQAQVEEALSATRVRDYIMLDIDPGYRTLRFATDASKPREVFHPFSEGQLFAASGGRSINLALRYLNPLRYSWSVSKSQSRDPLVESIEQFVSSVSSLLSVIGAPAAMPAGRADDAPPAPPYGVKPAAATKPKDPEAYTDASLLEWGMWLSTVDLKPAPYDAAVKSAAALAHTFDDLLTLEARGAQASRVSTAGDFRAETTMPAAQLLRASSMDELRAATDSLRAAVLRLKAANQLAYDTGRSLAQAGAQLAALADAPGKTRRDTVLRYSGRVLAAVAKRAGPAIEAREEIVRELSAILTALDDRVRDTPKGAYAFLIGTIALTDGQRTAVTVSITERKVDVSPSGISFSELGSTSATFSVVVRQSVITEFTQGFAFSNVAYPQFRTNETSAGHVVADAGTLRPRALAIAMLNLIPNTGWSGFTRLVGQLGVGATVESPVLLAGAGIRFTQPSRFTLTAGAAFPFIQQPKKFGIGTIVPGEAALKSDLQRTLGQPSFYIGIQR